MKSAERSAIGEGAGEGRVGTRGYLSEVFVSFQGEGLHAGRRQLFVRLSGCHLRCRYCDTPGSLERTGAFQVFGQNGRVSQIRNPVSCDDATAQVLPLLDGVNGVEGVAITGGEPLLQADFLAELLADARWPRPRLLETSGTHPERLARVLSVIDMVSMDIKLPSNTGESDHWEQHGRFLAAARGKAYVKVLVDEGTKVDEVRRAAELVRNEAPDTPTFLQPITSPDGRVSLSTQALERFFEAMRTQIDDVRVIPQMHKFLGLQ